MVAFDGTGTVRVLHHFDKPEHLHQVLVMNLDGCLTLRTLNGMGRQILEQELNSDILTESIRLVHPDTLQHLSHTTFAQRRQLRVYLIVYVLSFFLFSLYIY